MSCRLFRAASALAFCILLFLVAARAAIAQSAFDVKQIILVVGTEAGGGYDIYGRAIARHIGRFLPGKPTVVVQNMPGAGSGKAAEYIYSIAPKNGSTIGTVYPGLLIEPLTASGTKYRFEAVKLGYLGSADSGTRLCLTHKGSRIKSFDDAMREPSDFGGGTPGSANTDYAMMMIKLAGARMKIIRGYRSAIDTVVAMERAEIDGICGLDISSLRSMRPEWYGSGQANLILQAALEPNPDLLKLGVPSIWKYVTGENRKAAEIVIAQQEFQRPFIAPPGMPEGHLTILRDAFMATMRDADFLADAARTRLSITPKDGATVLAVIERLYASPPALLERLRHALTP